MTIATAQGPARLSTILRRTRKQHKITPAELAARVEVPRNTIYKYENDRTVPDRPVLERLVDVLDALDLIPAHAEAAQAREAARREKWKQPIPGARHAMGPRKDLSKITEPEARFALLQFRLRQNMPFHPGPPPESRVAELAARYEKYGNTRPLYSATDGELGDVMRLTEPFVRSVVESAKAPTRCPLQGEMTYKESEEEQCASS